MSFVASTLLEVLLSFGAAVVTTVIIRFIFIAVCPTKNDIERNPIQGGAVNQIVSKDVPFRRNSTYPQPLLHGTEARGPHRHAQFPDRCNACSQENFLKKELLAALLESLRKYRNEKDVSYVMYHLANSFCHHSDPIAMMYHMRHRGMKPVSLVTFQKLSGYLLDQMETVLKTKIQEGNGNQLNGEENSPLLREMVGELQVVRQNIAMYV